MKAVRPSTPTVPLAERATHVYRTFGTRGQLLYVGISQDVRQRLTMHRKNSGWWPYVNHVEIEEYPNRAEAFAAESWAIAHENPVMNTERQERHCPAAPPAPVLAFGHRVRRWAIFSGDEIPVKELESDEDQIDQA